jgi:2-polyprenyl-3-methyl-5-hydroxy-6-metoxy-1,4-benzoquinol methylase
MREAEANRQGWYSHLERTEMIHFVPAEAQSVLDVGCGSGVFGAQIKALRGALVWGVESNKSAARVAKNRLDFVVNQEFTPAMDLHGKKFDCIVFNDVLEHMFDPWSALCFAKDHLTENGTVVASIPNMKLFNTLWNLVVHDEWTYVTSGVLDITHIRFFTRKEMVRLFQISGYSVERIEGINPVKQGRKFWWLKAIFGERVELMRYQQFAVVARPVSGLE